MEGARDQELPAVSVIIPVRNRPEGIRACLDSLAALDYPQDRLEIVVVDDASTDDTPTAVESYDVRAVSLIAQPVNRGQSECRNVGAQASGGDIIAFIDSDCVADPGWLRSLVQDFDEPSVAATGGSVREASPRGWIKRYEAYLSPLNMGQTAVRVVPGSQVGFLPSCNVAVRRGAFFRVGGFDVSLRFGEDVDLVWRLCAIGEVRYRPSGVVWHDHRGRLGSFLQNRVRYATAQGMFLSRFPANRSRLDAPVGLVFGSLTAAVFASIHPAYVALALGPPVVEAATALIGAKGSGSHAARRVIGAYASSAYRALSHTGRHYALPLAVVSAAAAFTWPGWMIGLAVAGTSLILPAIVEWFRRRPQLDPVRFVAAFVLDSLAVGVGTLAGCIRYRTLQPLSLRIRLHPFARDVPATRTVLPQPSSVVPRDG